MAAGGASLLAVVAVFSMLIVSLLGHPRPLCSDCGTLCSTKCNAKMKISCGSACSGGHREACRRGVFGQCTADGTCCSSNGTCTCDCNAVAEKSCMGFNSGGIGCHSCQNGVAVECYPTCNKDCNNNCKKKECQHA